MESPTRIHFVRHGHVRNPGKVYYGRLLGFPLSEVGRYQATRASQFFREENIAAVYSSPQLRARQTAMVILQPHKHLFLSLTEFLDEAHSPFDGFPLSE